MREIKFRAWDKEEKKMLHGIESCYDGSGAGCDFPEAYFGAFIGAETAYRSSNAERYEVMQFTGLLDKNGKEIYEGDILHRDNRSDHEVIFSDGAFGTKTSHGFIPLSEQRLFELDKVAGNIHEHAELIK